MSGLLKAAVTDLTELIVTMHTPVPVQAPLQPVKVDGDVGTAVSVTEVLYAKA